MANATNARAKAEEAVDQAKGAVREGADTVSEKATSAAEYAEEKVNQGVHAVSDYLKDKDIRSMAEDVSELVRKHPLLSIGVGVGIGLLVASMTSRR